MGPPDSNPEPTPKAFGAAQSSSMLPTAKTESSRECPLSLLLHRLGPQKPERQIAH